MSLLRFFRRRAWDRERARELDAYVEIATEENVARGMSPHDARTAAQRKLGNRTQIREEIYHMNSIGFIESTFQDLRYAARTLRFNPGFTTVAIVSLALGIGANAAIFQLLDTLVLQMLPIRNPQQLVEVRFTNSAGMRGAYRPDHPILSYPIWEQVRDRQQAFPRVFAWSAENLNIAPDGEMRYVRGLWVTGAFFETLGVTPALGRLFTEADDRPGCGSPGAVISYAFFERAYGGRTDALEKKINYYGHSFQVIGVTPPGFFGLEVGKSFDVALPLCAEPLTHLKSRLQMGSLFWLTVMGRLAPGVSIQQASDRLASISPAIFRATLPAGYPSENVKPYLDSKLAAYPAASGFSDVRGEYSKSLWLLLAIAGLVLLIACANLANLMLARATARTREIAIRLAIGASRGRVLRQLLVESLLIASIGTACGALLAPLLGGFLVSFLGTVNDPVFVALKLDWRVLCFLAGLAGITSILFGLAPALRASAAAPGVSSGTGMTATRERFSLRRALVVSQIALSLVLIAGALLFSKTFRNLVELDAGFRQNGILIIETDLRRVGGTMEHRLAYKHELVERLRATQGIDAAAEVAFVPLGDNSLGNHVWIDGQPTPRMVDAFFNMVGPDYFKTFCIPFVTGRDFDAHDTAGAPGVAIVNEAFVRALRLAPNPVGLRIRREATPSEPELVFEIVGVVKNTKYEDLREEFQPILYRAAAQEGNLYPAIAIRSGIPLHSVLGAIRPVLGRIPFSTQVFKTSIQEGLLRERLLATLSGLFGGLAALLASVGLYGVTSYMVARRRNEIGIRIALGASRSNVMNMILCETGLLLAAGLAAGIVLALAASRAAASMLFGLKPHDPATLLLAIVLLSVISQPAAFLPARHAASVNPVTALREE